MKSLRIAICLVFGFGGILSAAPRFELLEDAPRLDEKGLSAALLLLIEQLHKDSVSTDSAWEVFSAFVGKDATMGDKAMIFVNLLSNGQAPLTKRTGYDVRPNGPFIRDCSAALSITREALLRHFTTKIPDGRHEEEFVHFDARKLFLSLGTKELENLIQEAGKDGEGQPASRLESEGDGSSRLGK
jgi:hypothetical protein